MKSSWYVGPYRSDVYESCYGFLATGYAALGGPEDRPYTHYFWGVIWAGKYTFGIGRITPR